MKPKHSRLHPPSKLVESATITLTPAKVKRAMKASALADAKADAGLRTILWKKSKTSLAALKQEGWKLVLPVSEGVTPTLRRRKHGCWEYAPTMHQLHKEDAGTALSLAIFGSCESAKLAMERGDTKKASGYAFLAGFYCGRSNAIHLESVDQGTRRRKKPEEMEPYLAVMRKHPDATTKEIIAKLPPELYESAPHKTHENRIPILRRKLPQITDLGVT